MILDPATTPRSELYAFLIRAIAPRPIAWVSTISHTHRLNLAPYSFFNGVSSKPPAILFVCSRQDDGSKKHTLLNIEENGQFVVNMVPESLGEVMNITATEFPHGISEFEKAGLTLASTDPEKLRAAQEAAAQVAQPPRPRRTRKPAPPPVDEPLIQVDTRQ